MTSCNASRRRCGTGLLWPYCGQDFQSSPWSVNVSKRVCAGQTLCPPTTVEAQSGGDLSRPMSQPVRTKPPTRGSAFRSGSPGHSSQGILELDRDRVVLLPHPVRRARPEQPARHRHPDVVADHWAGRCHRVLRRRATDEDLVPHAGQRDPRRLLFYGFVVLSAESAGFPAWATDDMPSPGCRRPWPRSCWRSSWTWPPVSSRLNVFVDPVGAVRRWHRRPGQDPDSG